MASDYVPFRETTPAAGCWCSRDDCCLIIADLSGILREDEDLLDKCIKAATDHAKSILRSRWPTTWPFSTPPDELRTAVAVMAVYRGVRNRVYAGGAGEVVENLLRDDREARRWLKDVSDSESHFHMEPVAGGSGPSITRAPRGEFGFKR